MKQVAYEQALSWLGGLARRPWTNEQAVFAIHDIQKFSASLHNLIINILITEFNQLKIHSP